MPEQMMTMECVIPEAHTPGQKLVWLSPTGQKVALTVPESAKPGQTLEFQVPESLVNSSSGAAAPAPAASAPAPAPPEETPPEPTPPAGASANETLTLEVVIPDDWKDGVKLATTLENGQRVIITPPDGAKPGMSLEFTIPVSAAGGDAAAAVPAPAPSAAAAAAAAPADEPPVPTPAPAALPTEEDAPAPAPAPPPEPASEPSPEPAPAPAPAPEPGPVQAPTQEVAAPTLAMQDPAKPAVLATKVSLDKAGLKAIYNQKTTPPWAKRATSDKYTIAAIQARGVGIAPTSVTLEEQRL